MHDKIFIMNLVRNLTISLSIFFLLFSPSVVQAQTEWTEVNGCLSDGAATLQGINCLFENIVVIAIQLTGLAMFVMLIIGGFKYLTAQGDPKAIESAKTTLTRAILGLILAISAWMIILFISRFTGVEGILEFNVSLP